MRCRPWAHLYHDAGKQQWPKDRLAHVKDLLIRNPAYPRLSAILYATRDLHIDGFCPVASYHMP